jgi:UDP:flavonoid glycosyltransferase YjiC (YdhE family)
MRVLMTCQPALSHAAQLVPLAQALMGRGHEVTLATAAGYADRLHEHGLDAEGVGPDFLLREGDPLYESTVGARQFVGFIDLARADTIADVSALGDALQADVIIREYAEFSGLIAAQRLGIPVITHGIMHRLPPPSVLRIISELERPTRAAGTEPPRTPAELYGEMYLDVVPPSFRLSWETAEPFLVQTAPSSHEGADTWIPEPWLSRLGVERPLLYVTLGTVFTHNQAVWRTLVDAVANLDVDALITIGPDTSEAMFDATPDNVLVKRFVPQSQVLSRAAALVCHAGFNTLIGAFRAGVPSVCLPLNADQPFNAAACAAAGAGLNLAHSARDSRGPIIDPTTLTPQEVQLAVEAILADDTFRSAAQALGQDIRSMPSADHTAMAIERRLTTSGVTP